MTPTSDAAAARWTSGRRDLAVAADRREPFAQLADQVPNGPFRLTAWASSNGGADGNANVTTVAAA